MKENKEFEERVAPYCYDGIPVIGKMLDEIDALNVKLEKVLDVAYRATERALKYEKRLKEIGE